MEAWTDKDYLVLAVSDDECIRAAAGNRIDGTPNPLIPGSNISLLCCGSGEPGPSAGQRTVLAGESQLSSKAQDCLARLAASKALSVYVAVDYLIDTQVASCDILPHQVDVHPSLAASAHNLLPRRGIRLLFESVM